MKPVRNSAKAIIIQRGCMLLVEHRDEIGPWYTLPGGGQHPGETLIEAVQRECHEEAGIRVRVGRLRFVREYIGKNHEFKIKDADSHQVEFIFECSLLAGSTPIMGADPDTSQVDVVWLPLNTLPSIRIYPKILAHLLSENRAAQGPIYLGDIN